MKAFHSTLFLVSSIVALPIVAQARPYSIRPDSVLSLVMEGQLTMGRNRAGDGFVARVESNRDVPRGSQLRGRVLTVRRADENRPGYMDLEFSELILPDGTHQDVVAVPVRLGDVRSDRDRNRDGRFYASAPKGKKETAVLGGAVAGFALGSLFKKQLEGAIIGTLAGIVVAESDKSAQSDVVLSKGDRFGARFDQRVSFDYVPQRNADREDLNRDRETRRGRPDENSTRSDSEESRTRNISVLFGDQTLKFGADEQPFRAGSQVMLPLDRTASQLGLEVEVSRSRFIYLDGELGTLRLEKGTSDYRWNGRKGSLATALIERGGIVYVPMDAFTPLLKNGLVCKDDRDGETSN